MFIARWDEEYSRRTVTGARQRTPTEVEEAALAPFAARDPDRVAANAHPDCVDDVITRNTIFYDGAEFARQIGMLPARSTGALDGATGSPRP